MSASDLLEDKRGFLSWLLTQIALLIAAGVLIGSITAVSFYNDWQKEAEVKNIALNFVATVESMDLKEFQEKIIYMFPSKSYNYEVEISTDYVTVIREDGTIKNKIFGRGAFIVKPYVRTSAQNWSSSNELHDFLKSKYGQRGDAYEPITLSQKEKVISYLKNEISNTAHEISANPLRVNANEPVFIEKTFVYFKGKSGEIERKGIVIIHKVVENAVSER